MRAKLDDAKLYGIVDAGYVQPEAMEKACSELLAGGAGVIQLRAKGWSELEVEQMAKSLLPLCREAGIPFVVNDFAQVAVNVGADGLHIGQDDGSLAGAREVVGDVMMIGRSTHSPEQAREALAQGFDYIGFGPLFPTPTKKGRPGIGMQAVAEIQNDVGEQIPVFCIGGITRANLKSVQEAGARRVVVVSDLLVSDSIASAATEIVNTLKQ